MLSTLFSHPPPIPCFIRRPGECMIIDERISVRVVETSDTNVQLGIATRGNLLIDTMGIDSVINEHCKIFGDQTREVLVTCPCNHRIKIDDTITVTVVDIGVSEGEDYVAEDKVRLQVDSTRT